MHLPERPKLKTLLPRVAKDAVEHLFIAGGNAKKVIQTS